MSLKPKVYKGGGDMDAVSNVDSDFSSISRGRRSDYFQSRVDRFLQLAAYVELELGQSRRDWKNKITPWRNEQRDIIMNLARAGASGRKSFHWIRQHATIPWNEDNKEVWERGDVHKIYARINIFAPNQRYIGMHKGPAD